MDALALNLAPTNTATTGVPGTESLPAGTDATTADFAALLALGLNLPAPGSTPAQPLEDSRAEAESAGNDANPGTTLDMLSASALYPQLQEPTVKTESAARSDSIHREARLEIKPATLPSAENPSSIAAAAIAADAATIAAGEAGNTPADSDGAVQQPALQSALVQEQAASATEPRSRPEAVLVAAQAPIVESRTQPSQPSALLDVAAPVSEPGFADALSRQIVWMVDKDAQIAELRINPPELGPVEVRLTLNGDEALAHFASPHAEVREALETAIARLRETMAEAGIQLGETSVSAESFADQSAAQSDARSTREESGDTRVSRGASSTSSGFDARARRGLVDVFA